MPAVLVTGATSGLGRHLSLCLADAGWTVLAHGRDPVLLAELSRRLPPGCAVFRADLSSLAEVRCLAADVSEYCPRLDVLVNNAAVGYGPPGEGRRTSHDGYELRLAVNYLAPMLLSQRLLPALGNAAPSRIVNVGSTNVGTFDRGDEQLLRSYSGATAYRRSKLALVAGTFALAEATRALGIAVNCVHPASRMDTAMVRDSGVIPTSTVEEGARAVLRLAAGPEGGLVSGGFFDGLQPVPVPEQAREPSFQQWLRRRTTELIIPAPPDRGGKK
jgi:NAD(P)-dependent dehydrogenase (short-subunit alcohol dehydrogenase family)